MWEKTYLKNKTKGLAMAGLVAVLCLAMACGSKEKPKEKQQDQISDTLMKDMRLGLAYIKTVKSELRLTGKITADQSKQIEVYPLVGGKVKNVTVELGDYIEEGKVMAVMQSGEAAEFDKQYIDAKSNYEVSKKNAQVAEDMFASKLISEKEYLQAKLDLKKAEGEMRKSEEVKKIYNLGGESEYIIKAPISGFIIEKKINKDMELRTDNGQNVFTIAQLNDVWVIANVYESDINKIKEKDTVRVNTITYPDKNYVATIDKIYNVLDPETRVMKVRIKLDNPDLLLKPEMYANVVVRYSEPLNMISIPASALIFDNSNNYVLIYEGNKKFKVQKIDLYKTLGTTAYVRSGITEGQKVVSSNQLLIYNALTNQ
jgi:cobalt-zinc-cadmium efflux system membrane fusion protein